MNLQSASHASKYQDLFSAEFLSMGCTLKTNFTVERLTGKDMTTGLKKTLAKGCKHCTCL
jgi:hypothetical protein